MEKKFRFRAVSGRLTFRAVFVYFRGIYLYPLTIGYGLLRQVIDEQRERLQSGIRPVSERR